MIDIVNYKFAPSHFIVNFLLYLSSKICWFILAYFHMLYLNNILDCKNLLHTIIYLL